MISGGVAAVLERMGAQLWVVALLYEPYELFFAVADFHKILEF